MDINVVSTQDGQVTESLELDDAVFNAEYRESLVHQLIVAYQANGRQATVGHKNRAAVRGGGRKPWRQKGTGRARVGTIRSPLWRGGGKTFVAEGRTYDQKLNRKMYKGAMRSLVSELLRQERLLVVDELAPESSKTRDFLPLLDRLGLGRVLILVESPEGNLELATRNLPGVLLGNCFTLNPVQMLAQDKVLVTRAAIKRIEERLQ